MRGVATLLLAIGIELVLVVSGYQAYSFVRSAVAGHEPAAMSHGWLVLHTEQALHLSFERSLQRTALHAAGLVRFLNYYYVFMYLPFIAITAAILFVRDRAWYSRIRRTFLISGAIGLIIFARFPVAPPRLLAGAGFVDTVDRYYHEAGYASNPLANQFAAIPSFHFAWSLLAACSLWPVAPRLLRVLLLLIPLLMLTAILVTGNHLWADALIGSLVVAVSFRLAAHLPELRFNRPQRSPAPRQRLMNGEFEGVLIRSR